MKEVIFITGAAGSGLSTSECVFEELGYYVVKNITTDSIEPLVEGFLINNKAGEKLAIISHTINAEKNLKILCQMKGFELKVILLTCSKEELEKRYTLTRRIHPRTVLEGLGAEEAINSDIKAVDALSEFADLTIDTTSLPVKQLRTLLYEYVGNVEERKMTHITFVSFGLKNGIPQGIDAFFDVRAIPNPYWVEGLKELSGEDKKVIDYLESFPITQEIIDNIVLYIKKYFKAISGSGRANYTVGIACSGGQHRSTYVANYLKKYFEGEMRTSVIHRDCPSLNRNED